MAQEVKEKCGLGAKEPRPGGLREQLTPWGRPPEACTRLDGQTTVNLPAVDTNVLIFSFLGIGSPRQALNCIRVSEWPLER